MRLLSRNWGINGRRQKIIGILLIIVIFLSGCALLEPKTTALNQIHESYRKDFQNYLHLSMPTPSDAAHATSAVDQPAFAETLREIREYRLKYGEDSSEAQHLTVLEGMIYIQSNQFGMANLIEKDVNNAAGKLDSGSATYTRDQLFANAFPSLVEGWEQIERDLQVPGPDPAIILTDADNIGKQLDNLDPSKQAESDVDDGAIYLATTASVFYVWVYHEGSNKFGSQSDLFDKGKKLIGKYLSETEKNAACRNLDTRNAPSGRLRYIRWYGYLSLGKNCPH
ncbi:MAG: hypothetical protein ACLPN1_05315 [Dissulfurispiraceae bacterium]